MGKKLTKREREKERQRQVTKSLKEARMQRGDKKQTQYQLPTTYSEKTISNARAERLRLEELTPNELRNLVENKCLYSRIYYKEGAEAKKEPFAYDKFQSDCGLRLDFTDSSSQHYFGFELIKNNERKNMIRIHYARVMDDETNCTYESTDINPKKISARKLVDMIGEYR